MERTTRNSQLNQKANSKAHGQRSQQASSQAYKRRQQAYSQTRPQQFSQTRSQMYQQTSQQTYAKKNQQSPVQRTQKSKTVKRKRKTKRNIGRILCQMVCLIWEEAKKSLRRKLRNPLVRKIPVILLIVAALFAICNVIPGFENGKESVKEEDTSVEKNPMLSKNGMTFCDGYWLVKENKLQKKDVDDSEEIETENLLQKNSQEAIDYFIKVAYGEIGGYDKESAIATMTEIRNSAIKHYDGDLMQDLFYPNRYSCIIDGEIHCGQGISTLDIIPEEFKEWGYDVLAGKVDKSFDYTSYCAYEYFDCETGKQFAEKYNITQYKEVGPHVFFYEEEWPKELG